MMHRIISSKQKLKARYLNYKRSRDLSSSVDIEIKKWPSGTFDY